MENLDDFFPVLFVGGLFLGEDDHAFIVLEFFEENFDFVADFDFLILEFVRWDGAFGFVADVHEDDLGADFEDRAFYDGSRVEFAEFGIDEVVELAIGGFRKCVSHICIWFGVVLLVRFPSAIAPESGMTDRHRGANRLPAKRKTDAQTSWANCHSKTKQWENALIFRLRGFILTFICPFPKKSALRKPRFRKTTTVPETPLIDLFTDPNAWKVVASGQAHGSLIGIIGADGRPGLRLDYDFQEGAGFVVIRREIRFSLPETFEIRFCVHGEGQNNHFEFKMADPAGVNAWRYLRPAFALPADWTTIRIRERDLPFAWGPAGGGAPCEVGALEWAIVAGPGGKGSVFLSSFLLEDQTLRSAPVITASSNQPNEQVFSKIILAGWQADAQDPAPWWAADFGRSVRCGGVVLGWPEAVRTREFTIEISSDGVLWNQVYQATYAMGKRSYIAIPKGELRCLRLRFANAAEAALANLELRPDAFSATPNEFIHAVAQDFPRGWFPRYWYREQSYWTPVGSPQGRKRALINEEGLVEVDEGGCSLEPFLWVDGKLITWAVAQIHVSLPKSGAPLPEVIWMINGIKLTISPWVEGIENELTLFVCYHLEMETSHEDIRLSIAVRPYQVNPPWQAFRNLGGRSPIHEISCDAGGFQVGELRVNSDTPADHFGAAAFEEGGILGYLSTGDIPNRSQLSDPSGLASAVIQWNLSDAQRSVRKTLSFAYFTPTASSAVVGWQKTLETWEKTLSSVQWEVPTSASDAFACFRTAAAHILINRDGPAIQPGPRRYTRSWVRDCVIMGAALAKAGLPDALREFVEWYVQFQYENGFVPCVVDRDGVDPLVEHDSHGQLLWGIREVFRASHDIEFLKSMRTTVQRAADYLITIRATRKTDHYRTPAHLACYGLLPESASHEGYLAHPVHSYWDDFWGIRGLEAAAEIANHLGLNAESDRWHTEAEDFTHDIIHSMEKVIKDRDLDYLPGSVEWADFDPTATANAIAQLDFADELPQAALHRMLETYLQGFRQKHRGEIPWTNYTAYEIRIIGAMVRLGKRDEAHELLDFFLSDRRPIEWNQWPEITWKDSRSPGHLGDIPHTWIAAEYLLALASMVAIEREHTRSLVLAAGVSQAWILQENGIGVRGLPTSYGLVDFQIHAASPREIWFEIGDRFSIPPGGLIVAPPLSSGSRIVSASLRDGSLVEINADGSAVIITRLPCEANLMLELILTS